MLLLICLEVFMQVKRIKWLLGGMYNSFQMGVSVSESKWGGKWFFLLRDNICERVKHYCEFVLVFRNLALESTIRLLISVT